MKKMTAKKLVVTGALVLVTALLMSLFSGFAYTEQQLKGPDAGCSGCAIACAACAACTACTCLSCMNNEYTEQFTEQFGEQFGDYFQTDEASV